MLMDRLVGQYDLKEYKPVAERAFDGRCRIRFSDSIGMRSSRTPKPVEPYVNLAREQACDVAIRLLQLTRQSKIRGARRRTAAFRRRPVCRLGATPAEWKEIVYLGCNPDGDISSWLTPVVLEQYRCYGPVARSVGIMIPAGRLPIR